MNAAAAGSSASSRRLATTRTSRGMPTMRASVIAMRLSAFFMASVGLDGGVLNELRPAGELIAEELPELCGCAAHRVGALRGDGLAHFRVVHCLAHLDREALERFWRR